LITGGVGIGRFAPADAVSPEESAYQPNGLRPPRGRYATGKARQLLLGQRVLKQDLQLRTIIQFAPTEWKCRGDRGSRTI
jgi:hypothetical protein